MTTLCWILPDLGYYNHARLQGLKGSGFQVHVVEVVDRSYFPEFRCPKQPMLHRVYRRHTLHSGKILSELSRSRVAGCIHDTLQRLSPDVVCVNGWGDTTALAGIAWAIGAGSRVVLMSESTAYDERRRWWREQVKRRLVAAASAALVGGAPQCAYLRALGLRADVVFPGYDAVDNAYFAEQAACVRNRAEAERSRLGLPERFFLAAARFLAKKNLLRLVRAYARYGRDAGPGAWSLVLLGDGALRPQVEAEVRALGLEGLGHMPGFKRYDELPGYYGLASAFVHASTTEQWGLVVNEAMASGLPVIVSKRCGCAPDLVRDGVNGFTFDPCDVDELAGLLQRVAAMTDAQRHAMGRASQRIVADWGPDRFAHGLMQAVQVALRRPLPQAAWFDQALLWALARRPL
jgi:glycosyltransferase involved in cell wall biosynthesis